MSMLAGLRRLPSGTELVEPEGSKNNDVHIPFCGIYTYLDLTRLDCD